MEDITWKIIPILSHLPKINTFYFPSKRVCTRVRKIRGLYKEKLNLDEN